MINITIKPEPDIFDREIRTKGKSFLKITPSPNQAQWKQHNYWIKAIGHMRTAYSGICAYCCHWIPYDTGAPTIEHFKAKDDFPDLAYEWSNYRFVSSILNGRKGKRIIIDPFEINNGFFVIDFPSLLVKLGNVPDDKKEIAKYTIDILKLNDESTCLKQRKHWLEVYITTKDFQFLKEHAPFIAIEIERQGLINDIQSVMSV